MSKLELIKKPQRLQIKYRKKHAWDLLPFPRLLIKHYLHIHTVVFLPRKCVTSRKCQSVVGLEVVATLSNVQGSKSQQELCTK